MDDLLGPTGAIVTRCVGMGVGISVGMGVGMGVEMGVGITGVLYVRGVEKLLVDAVGQGSVVGGYTGVLGTKGV